MVNQALIDVVKNQLAGGISEHEVREFLRRRGTGDDEIREIFAMLSPETHTLREIPVVESAPASSPEPVDDSVPAAPITTVAHGIEREVPPLQPSAPFAPMSFEQQASFIQQQPTGGIVLPPASTRKKRVLISSAIIGLAVIFISVGVYVYSAYFASPDRVIDTMFSNLRDVHSVAFSSEIVAVTSGGQPLTSATSSAANPFAGMFVATQEGPVTFTLKTSGAVDELDVENPKLSVSAEATIDKWSMGGDFRVGGEYRNLDRKNYIKVSNVPNLGFFDLGFLKDKWFMIEDKEAKTQLGAAAGASDTILPTATEEQRKQLFDAWRKNRFLTVSEELPSEDIDGVATHHYKLAFDGNVFKSWISITDAIMQSEPTDQADLDRSLAATDIRNLEIWIGKRDALPHKIIMQASMRGIDDPGKISDVTIMLSAKDYNEVMNIAVPEGAQSFEEVLQGVFAQMLSTGTPAAASATPQERNIQRKSNIAAIADAIKQNMEDNGGTFSCAAGPLPQKATFLSRAGFGATGYVIEPCIVPKYLSELPKDPTKGTAASSGYSAFYDSKTKKVTVRAPYAENGVKISIVR